MGGYGRVWSDEEGLAMKSKLDCLSQSMIECRNTSDVVQFHFLLRCICNWNSSV